ncbi:MAG TPA: helix-turn-helix domain-containing protein [Propionibacteriaceae bacterium]|nr:helix-turn-helix domain-containing protein [Propionibacteriaceae bacterium]
MSGYGQFCPVAKAMEVLDQRWTLLVIRELLAGSTRFNELRRGVPKMSPALLSTRLRSLQRAGLVDRFDVGGAPEYRLTQAGRELSGVVEGLASWGLKWVPDLGEEDLDPHLLMWDIHRTVPVEQWPRQRTVVEFRFDDLTGRGAAWWLVVNDGETDICETDPGFEVAATVRTRLGALIRIWRGDTSWSSALRDEAVSIIGPPAVRRALPSWIGHSVFAATA